MPLLISAPTPPTNINCKNVFDRSLTLTWNEPNPPNGYILHYIVYHRYLNTQIQTNGSVAELLIEGLYPGMYLCKVQSQEILKTSRIIQNDKALIKKIVHEPKVLTCMTVASISITLTTIFTQNKPS